MNITEMINRLKEIKETHGDLSLFFFEKDNVNKLTQSDVICIAHGDSKIFHAGVYLWIAGE